MADGEADTLEFLEDIVGLRNTLREVYKLPAFNFARCARADCPCPASYSGLPDEYCSQRCRLGTPCATPYHQTPSEPMQQPPPALPAPPPLPASPRYEPPDDALQRLGVALERTRRSYLNYSDFDEWRLSAHSATYQAIAVPPPLYAYVTLYLDPADERLLDNELRGSDEGPGDPSATLAIVMRTMQRLCMEHPELCNDLHR